MNRETILALLADDQRYREAVADAVAKWNTSAAGPAMDVVEYETRTTDAYRQAAERWRERCEKAEAERDALAAAVERLTGELVDAGYRQEEDRAERDALRSMIAGRCLSGITHRDEEHRQSVCMLPEGHAPLMHDDCMGCTWTDADHWEPSAIDALAEECDGWRHLADVRAARIARVREWIDRRGVDVSDRDGDYMDGYRAAQRHAVQDAAKLRRALDGAES